MVEYTPDEMKLAYSYTRFSSPAQKDGDSARRQLQAAKKWCKENGYVLSDERFLDEGKSAYKGKNLVGEGDLKRFIGLIENGKIRPGSVLVLESFDRLSRLKPSKAVPLFFSIINAGIGMVFTMTFAKQLITEKVLDEDSYILYAIIGEVQRSHQESKHKSSRVKEAYDERKKNAKENDFKSLAWCPPWCDFDKSHGYVVNEDRANIVRRIHAEYLKGNGPFRISRVFNSEKIPTLGHRGTKQYKNTTSEWYKKTVRDFLMDKRVYGYSEFLDKDSYFPVIISKDNFNAVQNRLALRANEKPTGGPIEGVGNMFSGVCRCSRCGGVMAKTSTRKRYKNKVTLYEYLVCDGARSGMGCSYRSISYETFKSTFYSAIYSQDFCSVMTNNNTNKINEHRLAVLMGEKVMNEKQIEKLTSLILNDEKPSFTLTAKLKEFESKQIHLANDIQLATAQSKTIEFTPENFNKMIEQTGEVILTKEGRLKVREYIRNAIDRIVLDTAKEITNYQIYFKNGVVGSVVIWTEREEHGAGIVCYQCWPGVVKAPDFKKDLTLMTTGKSDEAVNKVVSRLAQKRLEN